MRTRMLIAFFASLLSTGIAAQDTRAPSGGATARQPRETHSDAGAAERQTPKTDFGTIVGRRAQATSFSILLDDARALQQAIDRDATRSAAAAQTFGERIEQSDRHALQHACAALVTNERDEQAQRRLQEVLARHRDTDSDAVLRLCLDPHYRQLQSDVAAIVQALERKRASDGQAESDPALSAALQRQQSVFTTLGNVMKTRHDTAKNSISNVR